MHPQKTRGTLHLQEASYTYQAQGASHSYHLMNYSCSGLWQHLPHDSQWVRQFFEDEHLIGVTIRPAC